MKCMLCWGKLTSLNVVSALLNFFCNSNSKFELKNECIYDFVIHKRNDNDTIWSNKTLGDLFTVEQYCSLDLIEFSICFHNELWRRKNKINVHFNIKYLHESTIT